MDGGGQSSRLARYDDTGINVVVNIKYGERLIAICDENFGGRRHGCYLLVLHSFVLFSLYGLPRVICWRDSLRAFSFSFSTAIHNHYTGSEIFAIRSV